MNLQFPFDRDFQVGILGLMAQRYDFLLTAVEVLAPEYFEDKVLQWFYSAMRDHYVNFGEQAKPKPVIANELRKAAAAGTRVKPRDLEEYESVLERLNDTVNAAQYVISEVIRFCRRQAGRKVYLETAPMMDTANEDQWDDILERLTAARNIGNNYLDVGVNYFADAPDRIRRRLLPDNRIVAPTGIKGVHPSTGSATDLDYLIGGGLKAGQIGIWMGGTGVGKSIALPHCGKRAIVGGMKVVHYTLELDEDEIAARYDASWTGTKIHELVTQSKYVLAGLDKWHQKYGDSLYIKHFPTGTATINTLKQHLRQLAGFGWYPDVIIVDYLDLLKPTTNYNDEYADLGAITKDLRGWAGELKVPLWSATQVNRAGLNSEIVDIEHIGDSLKKAQIADMILALCATREERENEVLRIFGAKNRNGPSKFAVEIRTAYDRMVLCDLGAAPMTQQQPSGQASTGAPPPTLTKKPRRKPKKVT